MLCVIENVLFYVERVQNLTNLVIKDTYRHTEVGKVLKCPSPRAAATAFEYAILLCKVSLFVLRRKAKIVPQGK